MLIQNLYEPYEIEYKELDRCPVGDHKNNYFELVYILKGEGEHVVNKNRFQYHKGTLFLLLPQHVHSFEVKTITSFLFIRFNDIYLKAQKVKNVHSNLGDWIQKLEYILQSNYHLPGCVLYNSGDKSLMAALMDAIVREYVNHQQFHREVIQQLVNTVITVVARNISLLDTATYDASENQASDLIRYIHDHIYSPEYLKAEVMAGHFNISPKYIHEYFRKHTGQSLLQYTAGYKMKLVETRLRYSNMRINEIVQELGFTDESHLNRFFKKHKGLSPTEFRKSSRVNSLS